MTITSRVIKNARRRGVKVYGRRQWTLNPIALGVYQWRRQYRRHRLCPQRPADTLWLHITVTRRSNIKNDMRVLHSIGMDRFNTGVSYNMGLDHRNGQMGLGQSFDASGAHTQNDKLYDEDAIRANPRIENFSEDQNPVSHAIAFIGMPGMHVDSQAFTDLCKFIAAMMEEGALTKGFDLVPHSLVAYKDCPTEVVRNMIPRIYMQSHRELEHNSGRTPRQRKRMKKG